MKTILFTNARDEKNILEWIQHHLFLGFDYIYIFDHKSIFPIHTFLQSKHSPTCDLSKVHVFRLDKDIVKINLMKIALQFSIKNNFSWMLYLDCDEFLVLNREKSIQSFLTKYNQCDQVAMNWLMFGSNYRNDSIKANESIIQSYIRSDDKLDKHIKCIIHLQKAKYNKIKITNPHYYLFNNMNYSVDTLFQRMNPLEPYFHYTTESYETIPAFIAHYSNQSYQDYVNRKIRLPRDDTGKKRNILSKEEIHKQHNKIINEFVKNKYANQIVEKKEND
jgi:hypothetical protein